VTKVLLDRQETVKRIEQLGIVAVISFVFPL